MPGSKLRARWPSARVAISSVRWKALNPPFRPFSETWPFFFGEAFRHHSVETIPPATAFQHLWDVLSVAPAYPEVAPVFSELQRRGYRIAIGSNADDDHLMRSHPTWSGPDLTGILEALPAQAPT